MIESVEQLLAMDDPPTTRHQRARHGLKLVGVRYTDKPIGRNTYVTLSSGDGRPVKFKRTAVYRLGRR